MLQPRNHVKGFGRLTLAVALAIMGGFAAQAEDAATAELTPEFFQEKVWPIFESRCITCHGPDTQKAELRLDMRETIEKGSIDGPVVVASKPDDSYLLELISLPADDPSIMPPKGDPLTKEQIEIIRTWITQGASFGSFTVAEIKEEAPAGDVASAESGVKMAAETEPQSDAFAVLDELSKDLQPLDGTQLASARDIGALALPLNQESPLVTVNFQQGGKDVNNERIAQLQPMTENITWLNLAGTAVTDEGLAEVAKMKRLTRLHLERTEVTDAGLAHLKDLTHLEYLNLFGTKVTDAGLAHLEGLTSLEKLYVWQTGVTQEAADKLAAAVPGLVVNTGADLQLAANEPAEEAKAEAPAEAEATPVTPLLFAVDGCCAKAATAGKACDHECCAAAAKEGKVCAKCNATAANVAALFVKADGCCGKAAAEGKPCGHECCIAAAQNGTVCTKCNEGADKKIALLYGADGCCGKAAAEGKACEHPCCVEAAAKGVVCAKCNGDAGAKVAMLAKFDAGGCCAKAFAAGGWCDHDCCKEAVAKNESCAKCNPKQGAAEAVEAKAEEPKPAVDPAVAKLFDEDSCCAKALADNKACGHECCQEALKATTACVKCNPGAKAKVDAEPAKDEDGNVA